MTNAIPAGRISDADMAEILYDVSCDDGKFSQRKSAENDTWLCYKRATSCFESEKDSRRFMLVIKILEEESLGLAKLICKGKISDGHDCYDRFFEGDPCGYREVCEEIHEEEYDKEMENFDRYFG